MKSSKVLSRTWIAVGLLIGGTWWCVVSVLVVATYIAHRLQWRVWTYAFALVAALIIIPVVVVLVGGG
jgi:hypothetical protein